jgi:hypothetical protein
MRRIMGVAFLALSVAGLAGCCASPKRFYENAYGWNNPEPDYYQPGPPPPVTVPPGYEVAAIPKTVQADPVD